jgi:hypothetical protein
MSADKRAGQYNPERPQYPSGSLGDSLQKERAYKATEAASQGCSPDPYYRDSDIISREKLEKQLAATVHESGRHANQLAEVIELMTPDVEKVVKTLIKLRKLGYFLVTVTLLQGCAAGFYSADQGVNSNLSGAVRSSGLAIQDGRCVAVLVLKDGRIVRPTLSDDVCESATIIVASTPVQAPIAAAGVPPTAPEDKRDVNGEKVK